ncbi:MAG TPA: hypothetical protein VGC41_20420, partial [Kofleriaceae bacterium]
MRRFVILLGILVACGGDDHPNNGGDGGSNGSDSGSAACINTAGPAVATPTVVTGSNVILKKIVTLNPVERGLLVTSPKNDSRLFVITQ